jgi:hypothetical protein
MNRYYTHYRGVWYTFVHNPYSGGVDTWRLSDDYFDFGRVMIFNAEIYRLDQCFEKFFNSQK